MVILWASQVELLVNNMPANGGDIRNSIPGWGRSPGEGKGYLLQYSGLENSMNCIAHRVAKCWTWLSDFHIHTYMLTLRVSQVALVVNNKSALENIKWMEKEMATHSSILAWKIPWTEEPGRLQFMGSQRVGHNWAALLYFNARDTRNVILGWGRSPGGGPGNLLHFSCLENPMDRGAWQATAHRLAKNRTWLKQLGTHTRMVTLWLTSWETSRLSFWLHHFTYLSAEYKGSDFSTSLPTLLLLLLFL